LTVDPVAADLDTHILFSPAPHTHWSLEKWVFRIKRASV
jgi:hypothetical protein